MIAVEARDEKDGSVTLFVYEGRVCRLAISLTPSEAFAGAKQLWLSSEAAKAQSGTQT